MLSLASLPDLSLFVLDATTMTMVTAGGLAVLLMAHAGGRGWTRAFVRDKQCGQTMGQSNFSTDTEIGSVKTKRELPTLQEANSIGDLDRLFRQMAKPYNQNETYRRFIQRAGLELRPQELWLLNRLSVIVGARSEHLAEALRHPQERLVAPLASLQRQGLVSGGDDSLTVTEEGRAVLIKIERARTDSLTELFSEWAPGGHYEIQRILDKFTKTLSKTMPPEEEVSESA
ncbi:hypothetical protein A7A08_00456 [Methyloligella halotolerans]|uniref:Uncharacterized protein n=1 Tax=Methyloligella halotolerans TaxID=1177755 RepID=A0A1E2S2S1_9HYPH|nr:hypothetical protein [Methyloligella halotolerans]ODA68625.1 hypothetical protein A7A08_00456 [Methyloligella halotolerans]